MAHYKQKMRMLKARFGSNQKLYDYFKDTVKKPPKTRFWYLLRKFISFITL